MKFWQLVLLLFFFLKMPFYISFNDTTLSNFRQILIKNTFEPANSPTLRHFFSACAPELNQISFLYQTYFLGKSNIFLKSNIFFKSNNFVKSKIFLKSNVVQFKKVEVEIFTLQGKLTAQTWIVTHCEKPIGGVNWVLTFSI